jgi:hypothetical protein
VRRLGPAALALGAGLLLPGPAPAGLGEDLARCQTGDEAYQAWVLRKNEYDDSQRAGRSSCSDPGPAPP